MVQRQEPAGTQEQERTAVLGIRVTPVLKTSVKIEAARRSLTMAQLFEEMWQEYLEWHDVQTR